MKANIVKTVQAQPRLVIAVLLGALLWFLLPGSWRGGTRLLVVWDFATGLYLLMALLMMARSDIDQIRYRAALQDEGEIVILALTTLTALVSLAGIMAVLSAAKASRVTTSGSTSRSRV